MARDAGDPIEQARKRYDAEQARFESARAALFDLIRKALSEGTGPSELARRSGFTREYIAKIRDGKAG